MKIEKTLKQTLKEKADYANTATQVTNRIVKECLSVAEQGGYEYSAYIEADVAEQVLANLKNEFTDLKVEKFTRTNSHYLISWED